MKGSREEIQKRQSDILRFLRERGTMEVTDLAEVLKVTPTTIRRDLVLLEKEGTVVRSFGKASVVTHKALENDLKPTDITDEKEVIRRAIAQKAAGYVKDGDVLYLNSSNTASLVVEYLGDKHVTVITNNSMVLTRNRSKNVALILTGGEVYGMKYSLIGKFAADVVEKTMANICILGTGGISTTGEMTSYILPEIQINQMMLQHCSGKKIIVADGSKIGTRQSFYYGNLSEATNLITDKSANAQYIAAYQEAGIQVEIV